MTCRYRLLIYYGAGTSCEGWTADNTHTHTHTYTSAWNVRSSVIFGTHINITIEELRKAIRIPNFNDSIKGTVPINK